MAGLLNLLGQDWFVRLARLLAAAWAAFWIWFGLASGLGEGLGPAAVLIHAAMPGLLFGVAAAIVWRWERVGAVVLILAGLAVAALYPLAIGNWRLFYAFILVTMALPPVVAGGLLFWRV